MRLPQEVQKQADAANKHFESLQNPEAQPPAPEPETKQPDAPDAETQSATPEQKTEDEKHSQGKEETPTDEPKRSEAYWEHRFNVINGKYAAEVPALQRKVDTLTRDLDAANRQISELKAAPSQSTNPGGLTDAQIEEAKEQFGDDVVTFIQQMIGSNRAPDNSSKVEELQRELDAIKHKDQQKTEASFWTALKELVPDWQTVNQDQKFHAFLAQYDPQTGTQRQQSLATAQQALDADGVAAVFNAFKKQQPQPQQQRIPDDQVDPPSSRSTTAPEAQKIWTGAEIKQFYTDKAAGRYSAEEGKRLEADIFLAQSQGRTRP